jgi:SpoU rRNA methylase family enzyme
MSTLNRVISITVSQAMQSSIPNVWAIGSVLHTSALGSHVVVVNKLEDAVELFERRARIYSDQPEYPIQELRDNRAREHMLFYDI